jgi:hypothetical protein
MKHNKGGWSHTDWLSLYMAAPVPEVVTNNPGPAKPAAPEETGANSDGSFYNPNVEDIYDAYYENFYGRM